MYKLNAQQKQAVEYIAGPLIIVAGAGTGKTTVITRKIAYLLEKKLALPENILALAFNDKAAQEIQERVDELAEIGYAETQISTFHGFCQRLLEDYGLDIGLPNSFKLLTPTDAWLLIRKHLAEFNLDYYHPLGNPTKHIHQLISHFSKCKDEMISPEEYLEYAINLKLDKDDTNIDEKSRLTEVANAYHTYNQLLLANNSLDFCDLIYYTVKLLKKRPKILDELQKKFKYILVDEFQDVNYAQYELVRLLACNVQLTVVGDDDQSIYAFRGASVSNIMRFKDDYSQAKEIVLNQNYRSGQKILDTAYSSIRNNNPDRLEEKLKIDKKLKSNFESSGVVIHIHKPTLDLEAQAVIEEIVRLKNEDKTAVWDDFVILVRANNHAGPFINYLENYKIPYEFLASAGLYRQPIVLDCLNFFKILDAHHESAAIYRLLKLPFLNFTDSDSQKFIYNCKRRAIFYYDGLKRYQEFGLSEKGAVVCNKLLSLIHDGMKQAKDEKPSRILYDFLVASGYLKYLTHEEDVGNRLVIRQIYQLNQFFNLIKKYEENIADAKVTDFIEQFTYLIESGDEGALFQLTDTPDSVNIITVHKAKGLEYKYVFVVNLVEERFPTRRRSEGIAIPNELIREQLPAGDSHIQEERRLFYVAATRAKERLYLTSAANYGGSRSKKISRFLDELGFAVSATQSVIPAHPPLAEGIQSLSVNGNLNNHKGILDDNKSKFIYKIPASFSFSQIKSYNTCPYQYKLANIIKLPPKQSRHFSFGNSIHHTLQEFYRRLQELNMVKQGDLFGIHENNDLKKMAIKTPDLDELLRIYEKKWIGDWYISKIQREEYFAQGKKMLKIFYETNQDNWTIPVALESGFKIKIGEHYLTGRFDRVDKLPDGTIEIIDYKTGRGQEKAQGEEKEQLTLYQIAAGKLPTYTNFGSVSKLTLYYVKDDLKTSFLAKEKDLIRVENKIIKIIDKIKTGNFTATPEKHTCQNCQFRDVCEYRE